MHGSSNKCGRKGGHNGGPSAYLGLRGKAPFGIESLDVSHRQEHMSWECVRRES